MKGRESGMPDADYWHTFFDAEAIIRRLDVAPCGNEDIVEFGSGYGTFTLPAARLTRGHVYALDIETALVTALRAEAAQSGIRNLTVIERDFVTQGSGLPDAAANHAMIYNLLHIEEPVALLREARRVLKPGSTASVIHWRRDIETPRGPSLTIRPSPAQILGWAADAGFAHSEVRDIADAAPWHYGILLRVR